MKHQTQTFPEPLGPYSALRISSTAFKEGEFIPSRYTCDGHDVNPPLSVHSVPEKSKSLVLIVADPDCPGGTWIHWLVWNIPPGASIAENEIPGEEGTNDFKKVHFGGPCPPSGVHRYYFKIYALDCLLNAAPGSGIRQVEKAMEGHVLAFGQLMGRYRRH
ncbi:MAG TPA: YbhB/YbcL family Raf kinase inhibitor-like protein [Saprospiraceae bacterium]|nr:YbhB/YbcL family Raf kinase inhibitor-like protein [Saprospiraceae bacterium]HNT21369.1 YbhB/YbcL family Raf kinase inhibitor-like protein [Saprospiraceae bacterium]